MWIPVANKFQSNKHVQYLTVAVLTKYKLFFLPFFFSFVILTPPVPQAKLVDKAKDSLDRLLI